MDPLRPAWFDSRLRAAKKAQTIDTEAVCAELLASCHTKQRAFALDPGLRIVALCGRGCGKTTGSMVRHLLRMMRTKRARCLFIATTREQAEMFMWGPLKDLLEELNVPAKFNETKLTCRLLHNGSTLRLVGADNKRDVEKLRGQPFHEVIIDEGASYPRALLENLIVRIIEPRLGDFGGSISVVGTPGHILAGPFYDAARIGSDISRNWEDRDESDEEDSIKWSRHHWTLQDGAETVPAMARLWKRALLNKRLNQWGDDHPIWRREYLGIFAADDTENVYKYRPHLETGEAWNQWDPAKNTAGFAVLPDTFADWSYSYGMDFGASDPFALCVYAWAPEDPSHTLYHVYEFSKPMMYPKLISELLIGEALDATKPAGAIGHTGWPDAMVVDASHLGAAFLEEMAEVYGIRIVPAAKKDKHDAIELFNGDLLEGRIKVMKNSLLEDQLMSLQWDIDDFGRLREHRGMANHCTDSSVYSRKAAAHLLSAEPEARQPYFKPSDSDPEDPEVGTDFDPDDFSDMLSDDYDAFD